MAGPDADQLRAAVRDHEKVPPGGTSDRRRKEAAAARRPVKARFLGKPVCGGSATGGVAVVEPGAQRRTGSAPAAETALAVPHRGPVDSGLTALTRRVIGKAAGRWHVAADATAIPDGGDPALERKRPDAAGRHRRDRPSGTEPGRNSPAAESHSC